MAEGFLPKITVDLKSYTWFSKRENDDIPVPHPLEQYRCPGNSDSYFVNIGYDRTAISFVDLHTAALQSNIVLKQYAWPTYGILDENAAHLFITNLRCRICTAPLLNLVCSSTAHDNIITMY